MDDFEGFGIIRDTIDRVISAIRDSQFLPSPRIVNGPTTDPIIEIEGRRVLQFATANYLGLANNQLILNSIINGLHKCGVGTSGSRFVCGTQDIHVSLEDSIADYQRTESAVVFFLVTTANAGSMISSIPPHLEDVLRYLGCGSVIKRFSTEVFIDQYSHPSIFDAYILARFDNLRIYRHCDIEDLEKKLRKSSATLKVVATDGVFSSEGDIAPLDAICAIANKHEALVFVDDAHGTGVLGENGRGTWEHHKVENQVTIKVGSLSKALAGGLGGFVVGDDNLMDYTRITGRHYMFGGSIPPSFAFGIIAAIRLAREESWRRKRVLDNASYLRDGIQKLGLDTLKSETPIIPILVGDERIAVAFVEDLFEKGVFAQCFQYPAVPQKKARARISVMATHTKDHMDELLSALRDTAQKHRLC